MFTEWANRWIDLAAFRGPSERYRRSDFRKPNPGEHSIEHAILHEHFERLSCFGDKVVDGLNALPLVRDAAGGRSANVEADMLLLTAGTEGHHLFLCEVKEKSNNAWYAAVENLRQLRLFTSSPASSSVFTKRCPTLVLPADPPTSGVVLAPQLFYSSSGQKANSVAPTLELFARFRSECKVDVRLAFWNSEQFTIDRWPV